MQSAKDTFLRTMGERLATVNPNRTISVDGAIRPAVIAEENETPVPEDQMPETFCLRWGASAVVSEGSPLMYIDCEVSYGSRGTDAMLSTDRGRTVTAMDCELLQMCHPRRMAKCDYTKTPPSSLGTNIFWSHPAMDTLREVDGVLQRTAKMRVFFFPEKL